ncbi:hypothetical protein [Pseudoclavibacter sp. 13-3]|uniref:hypothetical protein n=1 Tax=Pseudoclavibacter sp. 13-3 TaxID=2901228 RepID=UPI001E414F39|nr:hypothetical protein [Pseudoclavibacter sp. 13-3]MCD7102071.1 hypothetical protein [Pseudoclavibacter sp. 13-3]
MKPANEGSEQPRSLPANGLPSLGGIEGLSLQSDGNTALVVIESISDTFKEHLQKRLAAFCYGAQTAAEDSSYYSFENTIREFLDRYEKKPESTKIGMAGELIVHVLMPHTHARLSSTAVFFNKEERSIKKGFDLTFHGVDGNALWYGEVKSGRVNESQTADEKSADLLKKAASDIADKLGPGAERSRWDSAIIDAGITLQSPQAATAKALLRSDVSSAVAGSDFEKNVVLASTVIHALDHCQLSSEKLIETVRGLKKSSKFSSMCVLSVQQEEIESVISFLREVVTDADAN